jgi:nucleoside-diphosphate-sugar epimerase
MVFFFVLQRRDAGSAMAREVCVTGGTGFIASHVIKLLLERGYRVRATVRDPGQ